MTKLTLEQYFGKWLVTDAGIKSNAAVLVEKVNALIARMEADGVTFKVNPITKSIVSGESFGGIRPPSCPIGSPRSAHKQGQAVDLYDPDNLIDSWLLAHEKELASFGLYFEHPTATNTWSHWSTRKPGSGRRFFYP